MAHGDGATRANGGIGSITDHWARSEGCGRLLVPYEALASRCDVPTSIVQSRSGKSADFDLPDLDGPAAEGAAGSGAQAS
jgi:hypothetical protein